MPETEHSVAGVVVVNSILQIRSIVFLRNHAGGVGRGGGFYCATSLGTVSNNTFHGNSQDTNFGGAAGAGFSAIPVSLS